MAANGGLLNLHHNFFGPQTSKGLAEVQPKCAIGLLLDNNGLEPFHKLVTLAQLKTTTS